MFFLFKKHADSLGDFVSSFRASEFKPLVSRIAGTKTEDFRTSQQPRLQPLLLRKWAIRLVKVAEIDHGQRLFLSLALTDVLLL